MTRDEVIAELVTERAVFDSMLGAIPSERMSVVPQGHSHSPSDIVVHVNAYEQLITERIRAAREGETTEFDRDQEGWEAFNERIWAEARQDKAVTAGQPSRVLDRSRDIFGELLEEIRGLTDAELNEVTGITEHIDPEWLDDHSMAEMIAIDGYEHYSMHLDALKAAGAGAEGEAEREMGAHGSHQELQ